MEPAVHVAGAEAPAIPDAIKMPASIKTGKRMADRIASVATIAEGILGLDRSKKQTAFIRMLPPAGEVLFCTPRAEDTLQFATTHARSGESRYRWEAQEDGMEYGYKVEGADDDQ